MSMAAKLSSINELCDQARSRAEEYKRLSKECDHLFLDPAATESLGTRGESDGCGLTREFAQLDPENREEERFSSKYVPDARHGGDKRPVGVDQIERGDLLLFSVVPENIDDDGYRKGIAGAQVARIINREGYGFSWEHAHWHHAATYLGDGRVVHAGGKGVKDVGLYGQFVDYGKKHLIRVRRWKAGNAYVRTQVADSQMEFLGTKYDVKATGNMIEFVKLSRDNGPDFTRLCASAGPTEVGVTICSQLFAINFAHHSELWIPSGVRSDSYICPAALSASRHLFDVEINWLAVS